jgi:hypothetical protein
MLQFIENLPPPSRAFNIGLDICIDVSHTVFCATISSVQANVHGNAGMNASKATWDILALYGPRNDTVTRTDLLRKFNIIRDQIVYFASFTKVRLPS